MKDNICFILAGKTLSGKTTLLKYLDEKKGIKRFITTTTRPPRPGEVNGVDYFFISDERFNSLMEKDLIVAPNFYQPAEETGNSIWSYGLDANLLKNKGRTLVVTEIKGIIDLQDYFGKKNVYVIYLDVSREKQLERSQLRNEKFTEEKMRRILADDEAFDNIFQYADLVLNANDSIEVNAERIASYIDYIERLGAYLTK